MVTPSVLLERAFEPVPGAGQHEARHAGRPARRPGAPADQQARLAAADAEQPALLGTAEAGLHDVLAALQRRRPGQVRVGGVAGEVLLEVVRRTVGTNEPV